MDNVIKGVLSEGVPALTSLGESLGRGDGAESREEAGVLKDLYPGLEKLVLSVHQGLLIRPLWKNPQEIHRLVKDLEGAAGIFEGHGHARLASLAKSLQLWASAFAELQELKMEDFDIKRRKARAILRGAGDLGAQIGNNTLFLEPFLFMMAGEKALGQPGGVTSGALMEQAAEAARETLVELADTLQGAEREYQGAFRSTYQGMVQLYGAVNRFTYARILFSQFDFDSLADETLDEEAEAAFRLLSEGALGGDFLTLTHYSEAMLRLLKSTSQFAKLIQAVFHSVYTGSPKALQDLKHEIQEARRAVVQAGLEFKSLVDYCDQLSLQVNNLARLASPSGKDFGKYSGLVAAAVFLPAVVLLSFANAQFGLGLDARTILEYSFLVGLVAGFGLAAMKFTPKGLFTLPSVSGGEQTTKASDQSPRK